MRTVFISYSHVDEPVKERLVRHLRALARGARVEVWDDRRIELGEAWRAEIRDALQRADVAILLVSADFLASSFIQEHEVPVILERRAQGTLRVVPLIVQPCNWADLEWLREIQAYPRDAKPLSEKAHPQVERELAKLARRILVGRNIDPPPGTVAQRTGAALVGLAREAAWVARTLAFAFLPFILGVLALALSINLRVTTPLQLDIVARSASFTLGGMSAAQLLNNLTAFSQLTIDACDAVHLPPLVVGGGDVVTVGHPQAVNLRCHRRIPGAKVVLRAADEQFAGELGSLGPILAQPGDAISVELIGVKPPTIRLQLARRGSFEFEIERGVPFDIVSEYVAADGVPSPIPDDDVGVYRAVVPAAGSLRVANVDADRGVNIIVRLAADADPRTLFKPDLDAEVESLSLFQRDDSEDALVSTALRGRITYPERTDLEPVTIAAGDSVRLDRDARLRLTGLALEPDAAGLLFRFQGTTSLVTVDGEDRRLTLFERLLASWFIAVLFVAVVAMAQYSWLRRFGWTTTPAQSTE